MKLSFSLFGRHYHVAIYSHGEKTQYVAGITNRCADGRYVLFLDYDDTPPEWVREELTFLIGEHGLGDVHVFRTNNGYHAISTQKFTLRQLVGIMRDASIDAAYLSVPLRRAKKNWTLRTTEKRGTKPEYLYTLLGTRGRPESRPHNEILRKLYKVKITRDYEDEEEKFYTGHYHIEA